MLNPSASPEFASVPPFEFGIASMSSPKVAVYGRFSIVDAVFEPEEIFDFMSATASLRKKSTFLSEYQSCPIGASGLLKLPRVANPAMPQ